MNALPPAPLPLDNNRFAYHPPHRIDQPLDTAIASVWHLLDQAPPPTLREILEAYKTKGDGDRDMLIAMLNAKSAEDQRLASVASLHRTMLDMYQAPMRPSLAPLHIADSHPAYPSSHYSNSLYHSHVHEAYDHPRRAEPSHSQPPPAAHQSRKRRRASQSPPPQPRAYRPRERLDQPAHDLPFPPSPFSSASTHSNRSGSGSPRSRESIAIGALLSSGSPASLRDRAVDAVSAERSTSGRTTSPRDRRDKRDGHT
ncbi:hypothetical protein SCP_0109370 [Sparassis crispa]|uniref:Uncharacterized protein n=1 Tax=Sparassis crispa TaxID=139825 RepID=A0A401G7A9_9APHY|nr:hypothetical protein SCP_0109370 [Sparassis crispa]GBE78055.1 hypothetical protein SCP_0109370 [Sparassis crispa]